MPFFLENSGRENDFLSHFPSILALPGRLAGGGSLLERKADGDETVQGEDDADPDGSVAGRVERKLFQFAQHRVRLLQATYSLQPQSVQCRARKCLFIVRK